MQKSILIDATHFAGERPTGVEAYVRGLLPPLSEALQRRGWNVSWIGHEPVAPYGIPAGVEWVASPHSRFWGQLGLRSVLAARKPGLYFTPSGIPPVLYRGATAVTVHDLGLYVDPLAYGPGQWLRLGPLLHRAARRAAVVLAPSLYTKKQLAEQWKVSKVAVTYEASHPIKDAAQPVSGVTGDFFLYVGRIERKKNLSTLVRGFAALEGAASLVLAGKDGFGAAALKKEIAALPEAVRSRILFTGYVSEGQKKWMYERALAVVVPCLYEGFGIPVLEAFAHRVPALCAQSGALPEVGGEAAWYVQGDIATDWRLQMKRLVEDEGLRKNLIAAGTKRLAEFGWDLAAESAAAAFDAL